MSRASHKFPPRRLRRDSFFGIHFDFHAQPGDPVGHRPFAKELDELLRRARPDYVQCDCKGHPGWSSYPTKVGYPVPKQRGDNLRTWREVTARRGVALFMHYSGVFDAEAVKRHPDWARVTEEGKPDPGNNSVFGPYVDRLMIPHLRELREVYGVDGYWIDGECWATAQDYRPAVLKEFRRQTGIESVPRKKGDPHFFEFTEFCREGFRRYLRHYVDELHRLCPGVQIASNWAFSSFMPEPVTANVDFLSGDYTLHDSVNSARLEGRVLMHQGLPWDLMCWAFGATFEERLESTTKSAVQLQREAAAVIALGGGFQLYFIQRRDGSFRPQDTGLIAEVAAFCREREEICHQAQSVPQVAVLYSSAAAYRSMRRLFSMWDQELVPMQGVLNALLNNQYSTDLLCEHHLRGRMKDFGLIVIPEWDFLEEAFRQELLAYVRAGGKLLVIGAKSVMLFAQELGVDIKSEVTAQARWLACGNLLSGIVGHGVEIRPRRGTRVLMNWHERNDLENPAHPAVVSRKVGRGEIIGVALDLGRRYYRQRTHQLREIVDALARRLFPKPMVEVKGSHEVDVMLMHKGKSLMINLLNVSGPHDNLRCYTYDEQTPLPQLEITVRLPRRPGKILLQPGAKALPFRWTSGCAVVTVPRLDIHAVVEIPSASLTR